MENESNTAKIWKIRQQLREKENLLLIEVALLEARVAEWPHKINGEMEAVNSDRDIIKELSDKLALIPKNMEIPLESDQAFYQSALREVEQEILGVRAEIEKDLEENKECLKEDLLKVAEAKGKFEKATLDLQRAKKKLEEVHVELGKAADYKEHHELLTESTQYKVLTGNSIPEHNKNLQHICFQHNDKEYGYNNGAGRRKSFIGSGACYELHFPGMGQAFCLTDMGDVGDAVNLSKNKPELNNKVLYEFLKSKIKNGYKLKLSGQSNGGNLLYRLLDYAYRQEDVEFFKAINSLQFTHPYPGLEAGSGGGIQSLFLTSNSQNILSFLVQLLNDYKDINPFIYYLKGDSDWTTGTLSHDLNLLSKTERSSLQHLQNSGRIFLHEVPSGHRSYNDGHCDICKTVHLSLEGEADLSGKSNDGMEGIEDARKMLDAVVNYRQSLSEGTIEKPKKKKKPELKENVKEEKPELEEGIFLEQSIEETKQGKVKNMVHDYFQKECIIREDSPSSSRMRNLKNRDNASKCDCCCPGIE